MIDIVTNDTRWVDVVVASFRNISCGVVAMIIITLNLSWATPVERNIRSQSQLHQISWIVPSHQYSDGFRWWYDHHHLWSGRWMETLMMMKRYDLLLLLLLDRSCTIVPRIDGCYMVVVVVNPHHSKHHSDCYSDYYRSYYSYHPFSSSMMDDVRPVSQHIHNEWNNIHFHYY